MSRWLRRFLLSLAFLGTAPALAQNSGGAPLLPGGNAHAPVNVNADRLEYFSKQQKAVYSGHVVARQGDGVLRAQSLTIFFSGASAGGDGSGAALGQGGSQVVRMNAAGPVTITQKDQVGVGDNAAYERSENKVVLTGNVSLTQGPDIVKGDRLIYDLDSGQAQVVGRVTSLFVPGAGDSPSPAKANRAERRKARTDSQHAAGEGRQF